MLKKSIISVGASKIFSVEELGGIETPFPVICEYCGLVHTTENFPNHSSKVPNPCHVVEVMGIKIVIECCGKSIDKLIAQFVMIFYKKLDEKK
ncbi:MAG: hypothetical protein KAR54_00860 [Candidatus Pacebacteria bacterium]|nr:hypothetical protein [Candidatus Paceibacterota bacterium]